MTYDDDELAEAALLLAHTDQSRAMPRAVERKILARGRDVAADVRFTTTKAGAVSVVVDPAPARGRSSALRTWAGWLAAAACVAVLVYQWRVREIQRGVADRGPAVASAPARAPIVVLDHGGVAIAEVTWDASSRSGQVTIAALPASKQGERYVLWLSETDDAHAVAVGSFACDEDCGSNVYALRAPGSLSSVRAVWLTRSHVATVEASPLAVPEQLLGEGRRDAQSQ